ncbi:MAG: endo-1,4-beta-xylanase [Planctomycetales bacterium]|nr:endo-1,4-beta-xylanase [Planctomycetales bacterium]
MGSIRFRVHRPDRLPDDTAQRVCLVSLEGVPWTCRSDWHAPDLVITRSVTDSGYAHVPWRSDRFGQITLSTATLIERPTPYHLAVELARGTIHRVATQLADWQLAGLRNFDSVRDKLTAARQCFADAVTRQRISADEAELYATEAIDLGLEASRQLMRCYRQQVLEARQQESPRFPLWLAGNLNGHLEVPEPDAFQRSFNAAVVPFNWRSIEPATGEFRWQVPDAQVDWCLKRQLKLCGGPLLALDGQRLPDWLVLWEQDEEGVLSYVRNYVDSVVARYQQHIQLWHCAARINNGRGLAVSDEFRLQLAVVAIEALRARDSQTPMVLSFDQPWGEYMARSDTDLSPLYFADTILRANLGVSGLGLEFNYGYSGNGMSTRDLLEMSRKLDYWSMLGTPLVVFLTLPSSAEEDTQARGDARLTRGLESAVDPVWQRERLEAIMSMLLAKRFVQVIVWDQWSDAPIHRFPHGGLLGADGAAKPALKVFQEIRRNQLA